MSTETKTARTWCDHWKYDWPDHAVPGARGAPAQAVVGSTTKLWRSYGRRRGFRIAKVAEDHKIHPYNEKEE